MNRSYLAATCTAFVMSTLLAAASCGNSSNDNAVSPRVDGSTDAVADSSVDTSHSDGSPIDVPPDGGPTPIVACGDASLCALPPSFCIDDEWLRYYTNGSCNDSGVCAFEPQHLHCPPSPTPPDCYEGGCRIVIVR